MDGFWVYLSIWKCLVSQLHFDMALVLEILANIYVRIRHFIQAGADINKVNITIMYAFKKLQHFHWHQHQPASSQSGEPLFLPTVNSVVNQALHSNRWNRPQHHSLPAFTTYLTLCWNHAFICSKKSGQMFWFSVFTEEREVFCQRTPQYANKSQQSWATALMMQPKPHLALRIVKRVKIRRVRVSQG